MTLITNKYVLGLLALISASILSFGIGRYTAPKASIEVQKSKDVTTHEVIISIKNPDGTTSTTTTIDSHTTKNSQSITTPQKPASLTISALAAMASADHNYKPVYGIEISKQAFLNTRIGIFGLTDGTVGLSVGLDF